MIEEDTSNNRNIVLVRCTYKTITVYLKACIVPINCQVLMLTTLFVPLANLTNVYEIYTLRFNHARSVSALLCN